MHRSDVVAPSRRAFLASLAGTAAVGSGCVAAGANQPVSILAAGSLQRALRGGFRDAVDDPITVEAHGSVAVARLVAGGRRDPDVIAVADPTLFSSVLDVPWYATFATNALALAYDDEAVGGRAVATGDPWFEPLADGTVTLGRTDPALDPLGYRTIFALQLAAERHDLPDLPDRVLARDQVYPETALLSSFETGGLDAAFVYRNMAIDRGYSRVDLPAAVDLSDPDRVEDYRSASYTLPDSTTVHGAPIEYAVWRRRERPPARRVFRALVQGAGLPAHGFTIPDTFPNYHGSVPRAVRR